MCLCWDIKRHENNLYRDGRCLRTAKRKKTNTWWQGGLWGNRIFRWRWLLSLNITSMGVLTWQTTWTRIVINSGSVSPTKVRISKGQEFFLAESPACLRECLAHSRCTITTYYTYCISKPNEWKFLKYNNPGWDRSGLKSENCNDPESPNTN